MYLIMYLYLYVSDVFIFVAIIRSQVKKTHRQYIEVKISEQILGLYWSVNILYLVCQESTRGLHLYKMPSFNIHYS